ncbi:MAG: helix-turn-helix transcriptional regulator [Bacteroidia bacterium]
MKSPEEIPLYTDREKEVMHLLQKGLSFKMIADILGISIHTVAMHIRNMKRKSNTNNVWGLVAYGFLNVALFVIVRLLPGKDRDTEEEQ